MSDLLEREGYMTYRKVLLFSFLAFMLPLLVSCGLSSDERVSFIAVGDTGMGNADQAAVAGAMREKLVQSRSDFVVLLGDNFYPSGVTSILDTQWKTKFEDMYGNWGVPVYAVLGNHDYGGGAGDNDDAGRFQIEYSGEGTAWRMYDTFYAWTEENRPYGQG